MNSSNSPTHRLTNTRRWIIVELLFLASMINYFDRATISFALPLISKDLNLGPEAKGVLLSAFFWSYALMQIPLGTCADRFNLRWLYAGALMLWSIAQGLTGFAGSLAVLIFFRILLGIGEAIYLVGGTKVVSLFFPMSERGFPCGLFDFGTRSGLVLAGLILPWMLEHFGWRRTFAFVGFAALLWLVPWLCLYPKNLRRGQVSILAGGRVIPALAANGVLVGGWIADRLIRAGCDPTRTRKGIISVSFLTGLFLIPAAHAGSAEMTLALIMGGCLVGLSTANQLVILQSCAPPEQVGLWVGIYNFVGNLAGILAPIATGFLIKITGSYTPAFVVAAVMIAAGQLSYWFIVGKLKATD
ncbi:MAG: MFS transporter [Verrucomicrobia bacterium]|nr:MFS transporter [Verrucomicrobiota bacterium]